MYDDGRKREKGMEKGLHNRELSTEEIKSIELELLLYVDSVCRKNGIHYSLMFGTLLGAVRHGGFIPWDDDIDICVPIPEYDRLIEILQKENKYLIRCDTLESDYYYWHAKLVDPKTLAIEPFRPSDPKMGVWIDIFPVCGVPENREAIDFWNELDQANRNVFCSIKNYYMFGNGSVVKTIAKAILRLPQAIRLKRKGTEYWKEKRRALYCETPYETASRVGVLPTPYYQKTVFPKAFFDSYSTLMFEGHELMCVEKWDALLAAVYGDYMTPPPERERDTNHFVAMIKGE